MIVSSPVSLTFPFMESCGDNSVKEDGDHVNIESENRTNTNYCGNLI